MKVCFACKIEKPKTEFSLDKRKLSGLNSYCKKCKQISNSEYTYKYKNTERGFLQNKIADIFSPSQIKKRNFVPTCSKEEIKNYFNEYVEKHGRNCFYCKEPWTYVVNKYIPGNWNSKGRINKGKPRDEDKKKNLSFDRLDSSKTYSIDNIIFCCTECNLNKNKVSIELIKRLYEIIMERKL
jgi:hypothetical protein